MSLKLSNLAMSTFIDSSTKIILGFPSEIALMSGKIQVIVSVETLQYPQTVAVGAFQGGIDGAGYAKAYRFVANATSLDDENDDDSRQPIR
jgi:hypothetical protein